MAPKCTPRELRRALALSCALLVCAGCQDEYRARVSDGSGLAEGTSVTVSGVGVGEVRSVRVVEGQVEVELAFAREHEITVRDDACARVVRSEGMTRLEIEPGVGAPIEEDIAIVECIDEPEPQSTDILQQLGDGFGQIMQQLGRGMLGPGGPVQPAPSSPSPANDAMICDALSVSVESTEPHPHGRRVWLRFESTADDPIRIPPVGRAAFVGQDRQALRVISRLDDPSPWFGAFELPAHAHDRRSVTFAGVGASPLDELEIRGIRLDGAVATACDLRVMELAP